MGSGCPGTATLCGMSAQRAVFGDRVARGVEEITTDPARLDEGGFWVVVATFEGAFTAVRMHEVERVPAAPAAPLPPVADRLGGWSSSMTQREYVHGVQEVRRRIAAGDVYQVNLCRVLSHPLAEDADLDLLSDALRQGNPALHAARIFIPDAGLDVVCASPETFLRRTGDRLTSAPIKGTAPTAEQMLAKDHTENIMITDLVRNDLSMVCRPGTVEVEHLCAVEQHPGFVHLASTVSGQLREGIGTAEILAATYPPGSVSGAPKSTALRTIQDLEPVPRGPYCGAIGWVDADHDEAALAVGIRTFWAARDDAGQRNLHFGTGAGITWGSDPEGEWWETVLKARRLVSLAGVVLVDDR